MLKLLFTQKKIWQVGDGKKLLCQFSFFSFFLGWLLGWLVGWLVRWESNSCRQLSWLLRRCRSEAARWTGRRWGPRVRVEGVEASQCPSLASLTIRQPCLSHFHLQLLDLEEKLSWKLTSDQRCPPPDLNIFYPSFLIKLASWAFEPCSEGNQGTLLVPKDPCWKPLETLLETIGSLSTRQWNLPLPSSQKAPPGKRNNRTNISHPICETQWFVFLVIWDTFPPAKIYLSNLGANQYEKS